MISSRVYLILVIKIEEGLRAFGRRNRSLRDLLAMAYVPKRDDSSKVDPRDGLLPLFLIEHEGKEEWFYSERERVEYFAAHNLSLYAEAVSDSTEVSRLDDVADVKPAPNPCAREIELHEVKMLNKHLVRLRDDFGLRVDVLLPHEVTGDDPPPRFFLSREGETYPLLDLRALVSYSAENRREGD